MHSIEQEKEKTNMPDIACPRCEGTGEEPGMPMNLTEIGCCLLCEGAGFVDAEKAKEQEEDNQ